MKPAAVFGVLFSGRLSYDLIGNLPSNAPSVLGTKVLREHFPAGIMGSVTVLIANQRIDFGDSEGEKLVRELTNRLRARGTELGLADVRSQSAPLGATSAATWAEFKVPEEAPP